MQIHFHARRHGLPALFLLLVSAVTAAAQAPNIGKRIDLGRIQYDGLHEISGVAASRQNPNVFWLHNDSGDRNVLYAMNHRGEHLGIYEIVGAGARDWEDIAAGPGPRRGQHYLYIGDFGDNDAEYEIKYIYRVLEPAVRAIQQPVNIRLFGAETIAFVYPDGKRDAESLMVDPASLDIYVVSKREARVRVYRLPYPQSTSSLNTAQLVALLPFTMAVAGDISPDGREILIKTYDAIYYWTRRPGQSIADALVVEPVMLPYYLEPQGEAIAWHPDGAGYYTVSEEFKKIPAHLYFYPRIPVEAGARQ